MIALREYVKVKNHQIVLNLSHEFREDDEVEVIVLPTKMIKEDLSFLEDEIDNGFESGVSINTHEEIVEALRLKYA